MLTVSTIVKKSARRSEREFIGEVAVLSLDRALFSESRADSRSLFPTSLQEVRLIDVAG